MSIKNNPLLPEYRQELEKVWKNDTDMVEYCIKQTQSLVKLSTGQLFATDKPSIETRFCFGYSDIGQGPSYDECNDEMDDFRKHEAEYFKHENLQCFDNFIEQLDGDGVKQLYVTNRYRDDYGANIVTTTWISDFDFECHGLRREMYTKVSAQDKEAIKAVYLADRADMEKRLDTYLKKYGTKKLHVWRYWIDE